MLKLLLYKHPDLVIIINMKCIYLKENEQFLDEQYGGYSRDNAQGAGGL